jgi:hypothetical protein
MGPRLEPVPGRRPGRRTTAAFVAVVGTLPIVVLLALPQLRATPNPSPPPNVVADIVVVDFIAVPADDDVVSLRVRRQGNANVLTWTDSTTRARTFYKVYRASSSFPDLVCEPRGGDQCQLRAETLDTVRDRRYVDPNPPPDATYRIGVAANWLDDETRGDVFAVSPPAAP